MREAPADEGTLIHLIMRLNHKITWFDKPTWPLLAATWLGGIVGGNAVITFGKAVLPEHLGPFAYVAILLMMTFGIAAWRFWYREDLDVFSLKGWPMALAIFLGLLLSAVINAHAQLRGDVWQVKTLVALFYCVVLIGFTEELWWRGIWFSMFKGRPFVCIVVGSLLFGLLHYQLHGLRSVFMASLVGLAFAVARHRGASIGALSLAHGFNDWQAQGHVVRWHWHASSIKIDVVLYTICLLLAVGIWVLNAGDNSDKNSSSAR